MQVAAPFHLVVFHQLELGNLIRVEDVIDQTTSQLWHKTI